MSLVAALLVGSSAFAIDNTKISGDARVYYSTQDNGTNDLLRSDSSAADTALNLNVTTDLVKNSLVSISAGAGYTAIQTLGLENNMVGNVWAGSHTATVPTGANYGKALGGAKVDNASWMNEAWVAATAGKTTVKVGRMELDTPLAFTEKWTIEKNTFEAAVAINQDLPDTTVVLAYVGNGNGTESFGQNLQSNVYGLGLAMGGVVNGNGTFGTYGTDGAYAAGLINNSIKPLTFQAWYYDVNRIATAYWLQADVKVDAIMAGGQYTSLTADDNVVRGADTNSAWSVMLGYEMKDLATIKAAYSATDKKGSLGHVGFNTATNAATAQSKLYTETWWTYGKVDQKDTKTYTFSVESPVNGMFDLGVYYTKADQANSAGNNDLTEYAVTASKTFGPLDATLAYINTDATTAVAGDDESTNTVQAYLTLNF
jgi:hypothetical protein